MGARQSADKNKSCHHHFNPLAPCGGETTTLYRTSLRLAHFNPLAPCGGETAELHNRQLRRLSILHKQAGLRQLISSFAYRFLIRKQALPRHTPENCVRTYRRNDVPFRFAHAGGSRRSRHHAECARSRRHAGCARLDRVSNHQHALGLIGGLAASSFRFLQSRPQIGGDASLPHEAWQAELFHRTGIAGLRRPDLRGVTAPVQLPHPADAALDL